MPQFLSLLFESKGDGGKCQGDGGGLRWCAMVVGVMMVAVNVMVARLVVVAAVKGRGGKVVDYEDCGGSRRWHCQAWGWW